MKNLFKTALAGITLLSLGLGLQAADVKWLDNFEKAKAEAKAQKLPILADFTGSDWCPWCMKLDEEVFSKKEFTDYASKSLILLKVDFPETIKLQPGVVKQNKNLAETFDVDAFPTVLMLDSDGKLLGRTGYKDGGAVKYVEHLKEIIEGK